MFRSMISPIRRGVAALAIAGVAGVGTVALAPAALADQAPASGNVSALAAGLLPAPVDVPLPDAIVALQQALAETATPTADTIESPVPDKPVEVKLGWLKIKLTGQDAQQFQTIEANFYANIGYQVTFDQHGVFVIGKKICDPAKSAAWNKGCVNPGGPRF